MVLKTKQKNDIEINEDYLQYITREPIVGGQLVTINHPYYNNIQIEYYDIQPNIKILETQTKIESVESNYKNIIKYNNPKNTIILNCIIKGTCQIPVGDDKYIFLKQGDMNIHTIENFPEQFNYGEDTHILYIILTKTYNTTNHFKIGTLDITKTINDLFNIVQRHPNLVYHENEQIKQIIQQVSDFKSADTKIQQGYYLIKFTELIIHIYNFDKPEDHKKIPTFTDSQIRVVRKIKNMISRNIASYDSLEVLSIQYGINITTLKTCFKQMYGKTLYNWYRTYKFKRAKELIKNTDYPITKIANMIGYKNSSKFSKVFKEYYQLLPSEYRKISRQKEEKRKKIKQRKNKKR